MWQNIIIAIIGIAVCVLIGIRIARVITRKNDPCNGCSGCDLKNDLLNKQASCKDKSCK